MTLEGTEYRQIELCEPLGLTSSAMLQKSVQGVGVVRVIYDTPDCSGAYRADSVQVKFVSHCHEQTKLLAVGAIALSRFLGLL